jgi:pepF/M3 family oligoendopeptidase
MTYAPSQNWDLESIFEDGPSGASFLKQVKRLAQQIAGLEASIAGAQALHDDEDLWSDLILRLGVLGDELGTARAYAHCCWSADVHSAAARTATSNTSELYTSYEGLYVHLNAAILNASDEEFTRFIQRRELLDAAPMLGDTRRGAHLLLPKEQQALLVELEREALHGWGQLYSLISGKLTGEIESEGETRPVSIAELNGLRANPDAKTREAAFQAQQAAWESVSDVCAHTLTQITGTRLTRNNKLGINEISHTLYNNRITPQTLDAIMEACAHLQEPLQRYLARKAKLLDKPRLDWWDLNAPISSGAMGEVSWERAQELVVASFEGFDPNLQAFAKRALAARWIEAEAREGKKPGGFCTRIPTAQESRIYMSFTNSLNSTMTLAHELGHAYHNHVLYGQSTFRMRITTALAETASTFAEAIVLDRVLHSADQGLRLFLIEQQLQRGVAFLMNIPSRYNVERRLYAMRSKGALDEAALCETVVNCQKEAYGDILNSYDPYFWCSKLHFYISHFGFYNWPYTFGYLFSAAVYQRFKIQGADFIPEFEELLRQTGYRWSEELAQEVLGEDIQRAEFWIRAARPLEEQIQTFLALTDDVVH